MNAARLLMIMPLLAALVPDQTGWAQSGSRLQQEFASASAARNQTKDLRLDERWVCVEGGAGTATRTMTFRSTGDSRAHSVRVVSEVEYPATGVRDLLVFKSTTNGWKTLSRHHQSEVIRKNSDGLIYRRSNLSGETVFGKCANQDRNVCDSAKSCDLFRRTSDGQRWQLIYRDTTGKEIWLDPPRLKLFGTLPRQVQRADAQEVCRSFHGHRAWELASMQDLHQSENQYQLSMVLTDFPHLVWEQSRLTFPFAVSFTYEVASKTLKAEPTDPMEYHRVICISEPQ